MIGNGYDEDKIIGMDAINNMPKPTQEVINKNRWSRQYRDDRFQGTHQMRRTDKSGGAGTFARTQEEGFEETLKKKPKSTYERAGGDSGVSSSSNQWNRSSWKPSNETQDRSSGSRGT